MRRYGSGYVLLSFLTVVGWIFIALSSILALLYLGNSRSGEGWIALAIFSVGAFQGMIALGFSAIGRAILEGSEAQQDLLLDFRKLMGKRPRSTSQGNQNGKRLGPKAVQPLHETGDLPESTYRQPKEGESVYFGHVIAKVEGGYRIDGDQTVFKNYWDATKWIDMQRT